MNNISSDVRKKFRFAILGCGMIANIHAEAIRCLPDAELIGAADAFPTAAQNFCKKYSIHAYESETELLSDVNVDVVCICTPSHCHAESAIRALECGKHVALEKPMALNTAQADQVIEACKKHNRLLTVISQLRFCEDVQRVKSLLEHNAFGKIVMCNLSMRYWRDESYFSSSSWRGRLAFEGGGALMNQGIHGIDLMQYILGEPEVLKGQIATLHHNIEVEDTAVALFRFEGGALGTLQGSTCTNPGFARKLEIHGDKGYVVLRENLIQMMQTAEEKIDLRSFSERDKGSFNKFSALGHELHAMQLQNLLDAIEGRAPLLVDAHEGRKAIRIIEDIYTSSNKN